MLFIPVILGTARKERQSEKVANFVLQELQRFGGKDLKTELLDVRNFHIEATGEQTSWQKGVGEKIHKADGFLIVSPEYSHGYPGELKLFLDSFYKEFNRKPVAFCGVSGGILGGARAIEQLRLVSIEFQMAPIRNAVYFREVRNLFDKQDKILDPSYSQRLRELFDELIWYAQALKSARERQTP